MDLGPSAIETASLVKTYRKLFGPGHLALRSVSLSVPRGACFGLIGPNGAGKTTFIKVLLGVARPDSGEVRVLDGEPEDVEVRRRIGYLPERIHLPDVLTARAYLKSLAALKGVRASSAEIEALLDRVGLLEGRARKIKGYSKGMRQRTGLAGALLGKPELLILDEPTDGIDPMGRIEIRNVLLEEKARGATILLNSHLLAETERICDRIAILKNGEILQQGSLDSLTRASHGFHLRFVGDRAHHLINAGFVDVRDDGRCHFPTSDVDAVNRAIDAARADGAKLLSMEAVSKDLEDVMAEALGK